MHKFKKWLETIGQNDEQLFLKAILDNPSDMTNWLVFADWLEEHGNYQKSTIIRTLTQKGRRNYSKLSLVGIDGDFARALMYSFPLANHAITWEISLEDAANITRQIANYNRNKLYGSRGPEKVLDDINKIIHGHGVEPIRGDYQSNYISDDPLLVGLYINRGDMYDMTVLYDVPQMKFYITDLETWISQRAKYHIQ